MSPLTWPGLHSTPLILFLIRAGWRVGSLIILNTAVIHCSHLLLQSENLQGVVHQLQFL